MTPTSWLTTGLLIGYLAASQPAGAQDHVFVGAKKCKKCHLNEWKSWSGTKMAMAFESLKPGIDVEIKKQLGFDPLVDYTTDEACVACHVTGYGLEGGFRNVEETPDLVGVGCEMCHGAGGTYLEDGFMTLKNVQFKKADLVAVGLVDSVGEAQCKICHNERVPIPNYAFDFKTKVLEGTHEIFPLRFSHD